MLDKIFYNWAKTFYKNTKSVPGIIILYREGLSDAQAQVQLRPELESLHYMVEQIGEKTKTKNYEPEIVYMTVNKKINSRFFMAEGNNPQQGGNKFIPKVLNPSSGSVIVEEMSKNDAYDFHLAAQLVTQGTCTPTHYTVAYNGSKIPQ